MKEFYEGRERKRNNEDEDEEPKREEYRPRTMADIRFDAFVESFERNGYNAQRTCRELKISKATFYRAHKLYGLTMERKAIWKNRKR